MDWALKVVSQSFPFSGSQAKEAIRCPSKCDSSLYCLYLEPLKTKHTRRECAMLQKCSILVCFRCYNLTVPNLETEFENKCI